MELRDDSKQSFREAIGLSIYSNSKPGVLSYVSIFENLWKITELYQELEKSNEQLRHNEILQKDFIHIAAHELKNPIQPILGLTEVLLNNKSVNEKDFHNMIKIINRNAQRLLILTNNLLDIAKIETDSLVLHKEMVDLRFFLMSNINEYKNQIKTRSIIKSGYFDSSDNKNESDIFAKLMFTTSEKMDDKNYEDKFFIIEGDKSRLSQVLFNLLDNAYKFTNEKDIITVELDVEFVNNKEYAIVRIKDTGKGIDPEIMPRLFTKFASKSHQGTGLGLFICKNIIESHGGMIWANNNEYEQGATFSFSLPLVKQ
jgi:signal transduction histidine kinase